ncbi:Predicted O-methyltransferase YrrM [Jatrophihabitans endophyticus]|uniref:Predicted O-methyltransferase YrrM n=1 Tax=Jatrophihabitans endophyticus TaxID=1206085 RepID=A0A1M5RKW8_9ACTN|nr:O-methyltransferase [Jatrophihabitans endophyticus]SHH26987.1 Predicted O-methyltransferase YrrM [Jatrophihabitans endophyticus]
MADAMLNGASLAYAESFAIEDDVTARARGRAAEFGCTPIGPAGGATLRLLAAATAARTVVEVGTGAGVSGLYLLGGMAPGGVLTTIDVEGEHQRAAKEAFGEAGIGASRYRLINGSAAEVLPRLRDAAYDLVFVDADKTAYAVYYEQALRLLRPGGIVAFDNALWHDRVADPSQRDPDTTVLRELGRTVRDDERLIPALLPVGDGLLVAARR